MTLAELDSRIARGTDIEWSRYADNVTDRDIYVLYPRRQTVRVILGEFGEVVRMTAPQIGIVVDGSSREEAWSRFLCEVRKREDAAWLSFDVGATRREEIEQGLNAPEDEDWAESVEGGEG